MRPGQLIPLILILLTIPVGAQPSLTTTLGIVAIEMSENEYWIQTSSLITIADVELGFTGLTSFEVDGVEQQLMGDLFIIVDGEPIRVTGIDNGIMQLPLTRGYHFISLLYMGKDNYGSVYSMDSIHVDISNSYSEPELTAYDFDYTIDDAVVGETIDHRISTTEFSYTIRDLTLDGGITANISVNDNRIDGIFEVNSYGSDISQLSDQFPATQGQVFFSDDLGIHKDPSQLYFEDVIDIGVLVIHEAGVILGDDFDGIMLDDATGSFDFHIEYQSFAYQEPDETDPTDPSTGETDNSTDELIETTQFTPVISTKEDIFTSDDEKSPFPILSLIITLILWRRKR